MASSAVMASLLQAVREHFGLPLAPLAACLGVSEPLLKQATTGRRDLPTAAYLRLQPLAVALPAPWGRPGGRPCWPRPLS